MEGFKDKIAVITGATTGIGQATLELLRARGALAYNLDVVVPEDGDAYFIKCDVRSKDDVDAAIRTIAERHGRIDMAFANAGVHLFANLEQTSADDLDRIIGINIKGVFHTLQAVIPVMRMQGHGSIVLMGSDQSFIGKGSSAAYGMTKGAIGQLTKSTAIDYAPHGIRVNCICPGTIDTPLLHGAVKRFTSINAANPADVYKGLADAQPIRRIARPEEIARTVAFLLSDESSFTTGALMSVDGGYVAQ
jgi:NAD(P)-dependent dehydrogenase (short-subunit alcohol dehydrogenase family)